MVDGVLVGQLMPVLKALQGWVQSGSLDPMTLRNLLANWEIRRKGPERARLSETQTARANRLDWDPNKAIAEPLHYRWFQVHRLLLDLKEAM